ncbi:unnamed protein product [Haemonchus placei]|uniref:Uncharacterized protein n=1 Tax=Haemonchus placei TaxID=6290 RepID=A0A3P7U8L3_HAEPC|nr:unnamed protein product [Haemonchus placei]
MTDVPKLIQSPASCIGNTEGLVRSSVIAMAIAPKYPKMIEIVITNSER